MTRWLHSGRRRDVCVLLYGEGERRGQQLKTDLERHYGERITPRDFYGGLDSLVESGFLEVRTDGLHDVYALTDAGRRSVERHFEWMRAHVDGA